MPSVNLTDQDWQQVMAAIGETPWRIAHPLLLKIGQQLQAQNPPSYEQQASPRPGNGPDKEVHHE